MQGRSVRDLLGRGSRARGRLNSQRRFEGVLTAIQHCQEPSTNLRRPASSSPMLSGAPRSRRCPRLPARQTTRVALSDALALHTLCPRLPARVLSVPLALHTLCPRLPARVLSVHLALHTLSSAPVALEQELRSRQEERRGVELNRLENQRRADEGQEERCAQDGQERVQVERLEFEGRGGRPEQGQQGGHEQQVERLEGERRHPRTPQARLCRST